MRKKHSDDLRSKLAENERLNNKLFNLGMEQTIIFETKSWLAYISARNLLSYFFLKAGITLFLLHLTNRDACLL